MFQLEALLSPELTLCRAPGVSKKRLFETAATLIAAHKEVLVERDIYGSLLAREKLGSTALGDGIAIPHCRVSTCKQPVVALMTLDEGIDFDAPDDKPVDIVILLLVPEEATQEHLNVLAGLARLLDQAEFCAALRAARSNEDLYRAAVGFKLPACD
jgi:PTS system nitrogen regulatory IIA component